MERKEFCDKLYELRKASDVKLLDICFAMKANATSIYRIEKAEHSFSMSNALSYLSAINVQMVLRKGKTSFILNEHDNIAKWLKKNREKTYSQRALAKTIGCANATIAGAENGNGNIGIDIFLRLADTFGFTIELLPIK